MRWNFGGKSQFRLSVFPYERNVWMIPIWSKSSNRFWNILQHILCKNIWSDYLNIPRLQSAAATFYTFSCYYFLRLSALNCRVTHSESFTKWKKILFISFYVFLSVIYIISILCSTYRSEMWTMRETRRKGKDCRKRWRRWRGEMGKNSDSDVKIFFHSLSALCKSQDVVKKAAVSIKMWTQKWERRASLKSF